MENFVAVYDAAVISCEVDSKVIKKFQLKNVEDETSSETNVPKNEITKTNIKSSALKKYSLYSCVMEDGEDDEVEVPRFLTMKGKKSRDTIAIDSRTDKMFKCKKVSSGKKIHHMKQTMRLFSKQIDKIHKQVKKMF